MEMKLKEFRKLTKAEKKEFTKSGGKVKWSLIEKFGLAVIILTSAVLIHSCDISDKRTDAQKAQDHAVFYSEANCNNAIEKRTKIPDSYESSPAIITKLKDNDGYLVKVKFKAKNALGVSMPGTAICSTDGTGKVTAVKIN